MGFLDSSTISSTNLEPTTWTLSGSQLELTSSLGTTSTAGAVFAIDKDEDGKKYLNPKKVAGLLGSSIGTTTLSTSINLNPAFAAEYQVQAAEMGITVEQEMAVNQARNVEEWFESLSDEEQIQLLASIDQKAEELQNAAITEKVPTKHL